MLSSPDTRKFVIQPQPGFYKIELDLSHTFLKLAETHFKTGNTAAARRAMDNAQQGIETVHRFLNSPRHAKHLAKEEYEQTKEAWKKLHDRLQTLKTTTWPK